MCFDKNIEIVEKIMIMIMATTTAIVLLLLSKMSAVGKLRNMLRRVLMNTVIYLRNKGIKIIGKKFKAKLKQLPQKSK